MIGILGRLSQEETKWSWREDGAEERRNSCHEVMSGPVAGVRVGLSVLYAK